MRILNVQLKHIHGGNPQACLNYTQALRRKGNEVFVLLNPKEPFIKENAETGAEIIISQKIGKHGAYDIPAILYFRKLISKINPDIIIAHEGRSASLIKRAVRSSVPVVDVNHGRSPKQSRKMDGTIVINNRQLKRTRAAVTKHNKIYKIPNLINMENTTPPQFPKNWHEVPVIGTIARLVRDKGLDIFIDALNILNNNGVKFKAVIAGKGEERVILERKIAEYNLGRTVTLPGWIKNPDEYYKTIDIFCLPSRYEEFGIVLLEAWKNGLPAVVTDADGPVDIVTTNHNAIMVQKENAAELAKALAELINNKDKADSLAKAGFQTLKENYCISVVSDQLQKVIEEFTSKNKVKE